MILMRLRLFNSSIAKASFPILFAILLSAISTPVSAQDDTNRSESASRYTVHSLKKGETLWRLADLYYGNGKFADFLAVYNNIADFTNISVGQKIKIPHVMPYKVKRGDTLERIARDLLGDKKKASVIAEHNDIKDSTAIEVGQILEIPLILPARKSVATPAEQEKPVEPATEKEKPVRAPVEEEKPVVEPPITEEKPVPTEEEKPVRVPTEEEKPAKPPTEEEKPTAAQEKVKLVEKPQIEEKPPPSIEEKEPEREVAVKIGQEEEKPSPERKEEKMPVPVEEKPKLDPALADALQQDLTEKGFENVSVTLEDGLMIVTYENRMYRHQIKAIEEVIASLPSEAREAADVALIPQSRRIPITVINIPNNEHSSHSDKSAPDYGYASDADVSLGVGSAWEKIANTRKSNSSLLKFDIIIRPQLKARFGDYEDSVKVQANLVPEINATLWKGMSLAAQLTIPIYNDLIEAENYWRPGLITANQVLRLPANVFTSATIGYFTQYRYGVDIEVRKYLANGKLFLGANAGYTGYASYVKDTLYYSDMDVLTAFADAGCRFPWFDLSLAATYGKFLYQDTGWRFDILRQFGEIDIGFFAIRTETGSNGGFRFSLPIPPSRYSLTERVRVLPAKEFQWEFRYKGLPRYGVQYNTGNSIDSFVKRLNPDYIRKQMRESH